jgi:hypothetical protein
MAGMACSISTLSPFQLSHFSLTLNTLRQETATLLSQFGKDHVNEYVFMNPRAFYWSCGKWFGKLVESAGLDHCTLHDLRKTANTLMQDAGVSQ